MNRTIPGINKQVLTNQLHLMENDGLISRKK
ncbi:winged helix-turn-helix transcriptional regulator [Peribacillus simplex]